MERTPIPVLTVQTTPYEDQRPTGGGGLRRPTGLFESQRNYLPNFVQSLLSSVDLRDRQGCTMVVGSDGRYFSKTAIEIVVQMAAANGVSGASPSRDALTPSPRGGLPPRRPRAGSPQPPPARLGRSAPGEGARSRPVGTEGRRFPWHNASSAARTIKNKRNVGSGCLSGVSAPGARVSPVSVRTSFIGCTARLWHGWLCPCA